MKLDKKTFVVLFWNIFKNNIPDFAESGPFLRGANASVA